MRTSAGVLLASLALVACTGSDSDEPSKGSNSGAASAETTPPFTAHEGSTLRFQPSAVEARRAPANGDCQEKNVPFADGDLLTLQPVDRTGEITSIAITFKRTVDTTGPIDLTLWPAPAPGVSTWDAETADKNVLVSVFGPLSAETGNSDASQVTLEHASVQILAVPTEDGDPITARVTLRFATGVLDATFSAPLESSAGACASP